MLFTITGKHVDVDNQIKRYAQEKTSKLNRYYDSINQVEVIIDGNKGAMVGVEIIARAEHNKLFIGKETGDDAYKCIDTAVHKLQRQLRRTKGKERDNKRADTADERK